MLSENILQTMLRNGRGTVRGCSPGTVANPSHALYQKAWAKGQATTLAEEFHRHIPRGPLDVVGLRQTLVHHGVQAVSVTLQIPEAAAIWKLAKALRVPPSRVRSWMARGIKHHGTWLAWCEAVDEIMGIKRETARGEIGEKLRRVRQDAGLTLKVAGQRCGLTLGTYSNYETGHICLKPEHVERMIRCMQKPEE